MFLFQTWRWGAVLAAGWHSWMGPLWPQQVVTCSGVMLYGSTVEFHFHGLLVVYDSLLLRSLVRTTVCAPSLTHSLAHPLTSSAILLVASLTHSLNCSVTCHSLGTSHSLQNSFTESLADNTRDEAFLFFYCKGEWKCFVKSWRSTFFLLFMTVITSAVRFVHILKRQSRRLPEAEIADVFLDFTASQRSSVASVTSVS